MRNLRFLIAEEEQKNEIKKQSFSTEKDEQAEDNDRINREKIEKVKRRTRETGLTFPKIYLNAKLLEIAYEINDSFMMNLKSDKKLIEIL